MKIIITDNEITYRADKNKKVKFTNGRRLYSEIVLDKDDKRKVEEVDNGKL